MPRRTLLAKLVAASLLPAIALLAVFGTLAYELGRRSLDAELGRRLVAIAQAAATQVLAESATAISPGDEAERTYLAVRHKLAEVAARTGAAHIQLLDPDLGVLADTQGGVPIGRRALELEVDRTELLSALAGRPAASILFRGTDGALYKRGYAPVLDGDGRAVAVVAVQGAADAFVHLARFRRWLLVYGALGAGAIVLVSAALARRISRPLGELAVAAERIGRGELARPIRHLGAGGEIALLATTLEEMRGALAERDQRMQMMLSGIAHEVRNPLGGMELFAGILREELQGDDARLAHVQRIERELAHLKAVVAEFLEYARRPPPELADLDCRALLEDVQGVLAKDLDDAGVACQIEAPAGARVRADPNQLRRALLNLGRNAIQATPAGGRVTLSCEPSAHRIRLRVRDSGPGISPSELESIFAPFYTTKEKGTGLGLAFVREIVRDHGGRLSVESEPGAGAVFTIDLQAGDTATWPTS
jgi:signal transduction histidine kinase